MAEVEEPPSTPVSTKTAPEKVLRSSRPPPGTDIHNSQTDDSLETPCKKTSLSALKFHRPQTKGDLTPRTKDGFLRENAWLREQVSHLQQDLNHVREENSQLHARIQNLMDDLVGGHQAHNEQEFLLQEAQKKAYSVLEDPMWESDSEKTTRRLDQFAKQIQQWSKQYASQKDLHELMETSKALRDSLERVLRLDGDGHPHSLLGAKGTSMALLAYLTHLLFEKIVTKPFFFLDSSSPVTAEAKEVGLIEMYIDTLCCKNTLAFSLKTV
jgi:predicted RNA-binding protein Jag